MAMKKWAKRLWIRALRSGEFKQGIENLCKTGGRADETRYCCLGVLQVTVGADVPKRITGDGSYLRSEFRNSIGLSYADQNRLISMNDQAGKNFTEIADYISKNL